jgi:hypothetical protein
MMRFRCPHCQQTLEVDQPTDAFLCPACEGWCRIPVHPQAAQLSHAPGREAPRSGPLRTSPGQAGASPATQTSFTDQPPPELPPHYRNDQDIEPVEFEIIEDGTQRRRRRKRRRRRQRNPGRAGLEFTSANLPLVLLVLLAPGGLIFVILAFLVHPMAGMSSLFLVGGGIWLTLIAAEDGLGTALCVLFVPFYAWYFAITNWDRVVIPFLVHLLGIVMYAFSMGMAAYRASEQRLSGGPAPVLVSGQQFAHRSAPGHQNERTPQPIS